MGCWVIFETDLRELADRTQVNPTTIEWFNEEDAASLQDGEDIHRRACATFDLGGRVVAAREDRRVVALSSYFKDGDSQGGWMTCAPWVPRSFGESLG